MGTRSTTYYCSKLVVTIALSFITCNMIIAQNIFLGEGKNNGVKLFWLPDSWPDSLIGFNILRKEGASTDNKSWVVLNELPIKPGNSIVKSLNNVTNDNNEIRRLINRRNQLLKSGEDNRLGEISRGDFISAFQSEEEIDVLSLMFSLDFDIPMLCGFAYYDFNVPQTNTYNYALQQVFHNSVSNINETFSWDHGDEQTVKLKANSKIFKRKNSIKIIWKINTEIFKQKSTFNGFNIYRITDNVDTTRLNPSRIMVNTGNDEARVFYIDDEISDSTTYRYALSAINIFNNESSWSTIEYDKNTYPEVIPAPSLQRVVDHNPNNVRLHFKWDFNVQFETFIKGFLMQRKMGNDDYMNISDTLNAAIREFNDIPEIHLRNKNLVYRIVALRADGYNIWSNPHPIFYQPKQQLLPPTGLKGKLIENNGVYFINLAWDAKFMNDTITKGYVLYTNHGNKYFGREANLPLITDNYYTYKVDKQNGAKYDFAIAACDREKNLSSISDTTSILTPTTNLPHMNIWPVDKNQNRVTLNWRYPTNIADLAGYRVYMNTQLVADESVLDAEARTWISPELPAGKYTFRMEAVSLFNVTSNKSKPRYFTIDE